MLNALLSRASFGIINREINESTVSAINIESYRIHML